MEKPDRGKGKSGKLSKLLKTLSTKRSSSVPFVFLSKSTSWPRSSGREDEVRSMKQRVAPEGCFTVYVGPEKERFVVKTEYANHRLFKMLLDEAEMVYGYSSEGPLALPCNVDLFHEILIEMDSDEIREGCNFTKGYSAYRLLSPSRV